VAQKRKKASRKKTGSARTRKSRLTAAETERFKQMLLEKRREIIGDVNEMEDEALKKPRLDAAGDLSSMPIHMADIGTDNYEQEFALGLMDSERKLLKEIDDALERIGHRVYGICEGTGKPIAKARLQAQPWARYCVEYARMLEQGFITEQEQSISEGERQIELGENQDES
jgi:RNA polymerase-binding protein DksA